MFFAVWRPRGIEASLRSALSGSYFNTKLGGVCMSPQKEAPEKAPSFIGEKKETITYGNKTVQLPVIIGTIGLGVTVATLGNNAIRNFIIKRHETSRDRFNGMIKSVFESSKELIPPILNFAAIIFNYVKKK